MRISRVYTKTGDKGETGLAGGQRVPKNHPRIEAYGVGDELMAALGAVRLELDGERERFDSEEDARRIDTLLEFLQNELFTLNGDLATRIEDRHPQMDVINEEKVAWLEKVCDVYNEELPPLADFVLPGGSRTGVALNTARTITRRAERAAYTLSCHDQIGPHVIRYLNRLSDVLFVLGRWVNGKMGLDEVIWRKGLERPDLGGQSL